MMSRTAARTMLIFLVTLLPLSLLAKDNKQAEAEALLQRARELSDIRANGTLPFHLHARVTLSTSAKQSVEGSYSLVCDSKARWREQIEFPGFLQVRLRVGDRLWRSRNVIFQPVQIQTLTRILDFASGLKLMGSERIRKVFGRMHEGTRMRCIEIRGPKTVEQTMCFDTASGVAVMRESRFSVDEFSQYAPLSGKLFPRKIRMLEAGKPTLEVLIDDLALEEIPDSSLFVPPSGAEEWPTCDDPVPPHALNAPEPPFPEELRGRNGKALISIVVGTNGNVVAAHVLETSAPEFSAAATETVLRSWRFRPATCMGSPIPSEVYVDVSFRTPF